MKGVSPVVATVLMVAVAIAAAVVAYSWFMSMQASVQAEASRGAGTVGKERLKIDAVYCDTTPNPDQLVIKIRNLGDEDLNGVFTVTVKDAATGVVINSFSASKYLPAGGTTEISKDLNQIWDSTVTTCTNTNLTSRIVVEVMAPGGAVASVQQRIR